jgi:antitoxin component of MazEF toxin-antitoxin module
MIAQIRKAGNSFVIRVPRDELDRLGVGVDDYVQVDLHAIDIVPRLAPNLEAVVAERLAQPDVAAAIKLLADA